MTTNVPNSLATPVHASLPRAYGPAVAVFMAILLGSMALGSPAEMHNLITVLAVCAATAVFFAQKNARLNTLLLAQARLLDTNEALFLNTLDHATSGLALISPEGKWIRVNAAVSRIVGYSAEELMKIDFQTITHPADLDADLHFVQQIIDRKIETYSMEKRYIRKDGQVVWILLSVSAAWNAEGKLRHFISRIDDINERKLLQEKLRNAGRA